MQEKDETVVHEEVLRIRRRVQDVGWRAVLAQLEHEEPVLAGFTLAASYVLEQKLRKLGVSPHALLVIERDVMTAQLICIESMRQASRALWQDFLPDADAEPEATS